MLFAGSMAQSGAENPIPIIASVTESLLVRLLHPAWHVTILIRRKGETAPGAASRRRGGAPNRERKFNGGSGVEQPVNIVLWSPASRMIFSGALSVFLRVEP